MDATAKVRRRIALKRLNEAYLCAKRCLTDPVYKDRFTTHCERLPGLLDSFDDAHTKVLSSIESDDEDTFQHEEETRTTFDETYSDIMELKIKIFGVTPKSSSDTPGRTSSSNEILTLGKSQAQVKLPRIELKTFDGDYKSWLPFRDLFDTLIHQNESLSNVEKFSYLLSSLQGPALNLIKVFPLSDANYEEAYRTLSHRYENKRHLAFMSWEAIVNAKLSANNSASLRQLLDIFSENLAILKNLNLPIDNWDFVLFHTLISKLNASTRKEFEMTVTSHDIPSFDILKTFVLRYCQAWERSSTQLDSSPPPVLAAAKGKSTVAVHRPVVTKPDKPVPHTTLVVSTNNNNCSLCAKNHFVGHCPDFQSLSTQKKFETVKAGRWCVNCLRASHTTRFCKSKSTCLSCGRRHHTLLHLPSKPSNDSQVSNSPTASSSRPAGAPSNEHTAVSALTSTVIRGKVCMLSTAKVELLDGKGNYQEVRVLLDGGSHVNFMTDSCAKRLGLKKSQIASPSYGLDLNEIADLGMVQCAMRPCGHPGRSLFFEANIVRKICHDLPSVNVHLDTIPQFKNITFADPTLATPGPIDVLLGGEMLQHVLLPGLIPATDTSPLALDTIFGWVLTGTVPCEGASRATALLVTSNHSLHAAVERFWEIENIPGDQLSSPDDQLCEDRFKHTHSRDKQGRYIVELPLKCDVPFFTNMRSIALKRFYTCENRLKRNPNLRESYGTFMQDYLDSNHMSQVPADDTNRSDAYYIPHHCVINEQSASTRLRVVFDASAKDSKGNSLNQNQLTGPKLQMDIPAILLRFRIHNVVFTADIRQMYRQILVKDTHRHLQRILWRFDPSEPIKEYELNTVSYGVSSAPFLALRVVQQLATDEGETYPLAAEVLKRDIYVDDIPCGADSVESCLTLQQQLIDIMAKGGFELRKWASNDPALLECLPPEHCLSKSQTCDLDQDHFVKVLGLRWDPISDQYVYDVHPLNRECSKRNILSELARVFDPLGFIAPIKFLAKCLVQKLWLLGIDWDEQPSQEVVDLWKQYIDQLPLLSKLTIPRQITNTLALSYQLHGFGDASEAGYGAAIYIRYILPDSTFRAQLVCAKSRVAPVKRLTLPRLELCAAVLVADLMRYVLVSLAPLLSPHTIFLWSDSMITLAWIQSSPMRWKTFIANRISRIQRKVPDAVWNYVESKSNPADCVSRGLLPEKLIEHPLWFTGPEWLVSSQENWPSVRPIPSQALLLSEQEQRKSALTTTTNDDGIMHLLLRFSSLKKIQRVVVYVQRFIKATRKLPVTAGAITASEMDVALNLMVSRVQKQTFADEITCLQKGKFLSKPIRKLSPFISEDYSSCWRSDRKCPTNL